MWQVNVDLHEHIENRQVIVMSESITKVHNTHTHDENLVI